MSRQNKIQILKSILILNETVHFKIINLKYKEKLTIFKSLIYIHIGRKI
jgi:hypothetical protein